MQQMPPTQNRTVVAATLDTVTTWQQNNLNGQATYLDDYGRVVTPMEFLARPNQPQMLHELGESLKQYGVTDQDLGNLPPGQLDLLFNTLNGDYGNEVTLVGVNDRVAGAFQQLLANEYAQTHQGVRVVSDRVGWSDFLEQDGLITRDDADQFNLQPNDRGLQGTPQQIEVQFRAKMRDTVSKNRYNQRDPNQVVRETDDERRIRHDRLVNRRNRRGARELTVDEQQVLKQQTRDYDRNNL